jgi:hypothetical protein
MTFITTFSYDSGRWSRVTCAVGSSSGLGTGLAVLAKGSAYQGAVLRGQVGARSWYADLWAGAFLARRGLPVIFAECIWEPTSRALFSLGQHHTQRGVDATPSGGAGFVTKLMHAIDTPRTHYCLLSNAEVDRFVATWNVSRSRVHVTHYCATGSESSRAGTPHGAGSGGVFAGGNSLRDYRALLEVAAWIPAPVTVATGLVEPFATDHVRVSSLSPPAYDRVAAAATIVVVPLRADTSRSAGQQTFLTAMFNAKPVVVTDAPGVREYIEDGRTGLIVPPDDPRALLEAIRGLLTDPARAAEIGAAARAEVLGRFTVDHYFERLLEVAESATRQAN